MKEFVMKLRILLRSELTLFRADAQRRGNQALLAAVSLGCVFVALVFVNMGIFFMLTDSDIESRAAFILAGGNLALAIVPLLLRRQSKPGPEEVMVRDIRDMAMDEVTRDVESVAQDVEGLRNSISQVRSGVSSLAGGGMPAIGPVLGMAINMLKKK